MIAGYNQVLLDTHAAIWFVGGTLARAATEAIVFAGSRDGVLVSPVTAWEIGLLARRKGDRPPRVEFDPNVETWLRVLMSRPIIVATPLTHEIALAASLLPGPLHGDPADRLLVATARSLGIPLVTRDESILAYAKAGFVNAIVC